MRGFVGLGGAAAALSLGLISIADGVAPARAADIPRAMPVKAPVAVASQAPVTWTGFYLGLGVGFRSTEADATVTSGSLGGINQFPAICAALAPPFGGCVAGEPLNDTAFRISPYFGVNWQFAPRWVAGIEGDWGYADRTTTLNGMHYPASGYMSGIAADVFSVRTTWDASVRGRLGFLANPSMLFYGTAGASWLHVESTSTCNTFTNGICSPAATSGPISITNSRTLTGWTAGGGVEAMLWGNWIARGEYRYADYGTVSHTNTRTVLGVAPQIVSYDLHVKSHTATFGIAHKFGGGRIATAGADAPETASSWSGPYLGAGLGIRSTRSDATTKSLLIGAVDALAGNCTALAPFGGCITSEPLNDTAFRGAAYLGFNWQVAPRWVVGVEADAGFADKTTTLAGLSYPLTGIATMSGQATDSFSVRTTWDGSARARIGFLTTPSVLLYATGGLAWLHVESTSTCGTAVNQLCSPGIGPSAITNSTNKFGWTAGGGVEGMLWSNWIARAEYRYADLGTISNTDIRTGGLDVIASYDLRLTSHTATLGLAYKFGWAGPVTARY